MLYNIVLRLLRMWSFRKSETISSRLNCNILITNEIDFKMENLWKN